MTTALILGAAVWANGPSPTMRRRTLCAARLFHTGVVTHLIPCGGLGQHAPTEAEAMQDILISEGIPQDAITLEDSSTNTAQNIRNALPLIPAGPVIIVTDWYHGPRARMVARRNGVPARSVAPSLKGAKFKPQLKGALREIPAYIVYALGLRR